MTARWGVVVVLASAAAGCASYPSPRTPGRPPLPLPAELAAYYGYPGAPSQASVEPVRERRGVRESLVRFPLSASGFEPTEPVVEFEWFESTAEGRRPAIVFNPILGGDYPLERGICRHLASRGFHVALLHRKTLKISPEHEVERLEVLLRQAVLRLRQVVDWMSAQARVDPERLGSFGISMGGMTSVLAAAVEPRLKAHVVALAGGSIPDVLITSRDRLLTKPLQRYLERRQLDRATLEQRLREAIRTDPVRLAPYVERDEVLMFITLFDRTVGRANEFRLWRALDRPRVIFLPFGHYTAYLTLPYLKAASVRYFQRAL